MTKPLPIIRKERDWLKSDQNFGLSDEEIDQLPTDSAGKYPISLDTDSLLQVLDVEKRLTRIERALGLSRVDIHGIGDRVVGLTNELMLGRIRDHARQSPSDIEELCELLAELSPMDYKMLQDFWDLKYSPGRVEEALYMYGRKHPRHGTSAMYKALSNLHLIANTPALTLPVSR